MDFWFVYSAITGTFQCPVTECWIPENINIKKQCTKLYTVRIVYRLSLQSVGRYHTLIVQCIYLTCTKTFGLLACLQYIYYLDRIKCPLTKSWMPLGCFKYQPLQIAARSIDFYDITQYQSDIIFQNKRTVRLICGSDPYYFSQKRKNGFDFISGRKDNTPTIC